VAAFAGADDNTVVDGDFAVTDSELQRDPHDGRTAAAEHVTICHDVRRRNVAAYVK